MRVNDAPEPDPSHEFTAAEIDQILGAQLDAHIDATLDAVRWPAYASAYEREMAADLRLSRGLAGR